MEKPKKNRKKSKFGPGFLVAAAFIGPGTVTTASKAGAIFGYSLIWVVVLSIAAAIILQEMVGRFSLATRVDVAAALVKFTSRTWVKRAFQGLAFVAIIVGCAAYEAGNIIGGQLGLSSLIDIPPYIWGLTVSAAAAILLWNRNYRLIEKFLIGLVVVMGASFLLCAIIVKPDLSKIFSGFAPSVPDDSLIYILGLLGTTVVPYNIFLHSSTILKKWKDKDDIPAMRTDTFLSIGLGGIITIAIIVTSAVAYFPQQIAIKTAGDLSTQLEPLAGAAAKWFMGIGLFSAGLSSAITAPYAAAWTASGLFGWKEDSWKFRAVFLSLIGFGALTAVLSVNRLHIIVIAQVTNALLLPIVALFVLYLLNKKETGDFKNTLVHNILFIIVFMVIALGILKKVL